MGGRQRQPRSRSAMAGVLWLLAAALATTALGADYRRSGTWDRTRAAVALVCLAAGGAAFVPRRWWPTAPARRDEP